MTFKSILKPEGSMVAGATVMGLVFGTYQLSIGSISQAHASSANHGSLQSGARKAGWMSLILVGGIGLIAKDANILILGSATIIAMELTYRHAIMADPETGKVIPPGSSAYLAAQNVYPLNQQADASGY